ncbi:uncharacterized protein DUF3592 [Tahibacter aquaticus]|uniref:Uncharacterized protein DUF3592 n=1 Tax=Tahibacter aquaticus TaxID=520092 RepID=A0A4R6YU20_9GAMM|nr:DUF3592 domain-containing protein [Tahibacter aquaticus]TDR42024.1 uncharacterized protein DUF3592 [Tahibacter aquaticus]
MTSAIRRLMLPVPALLIGLLALSYSALLYQESRSVEQHGVLAPVQAIQNTKKIKRSGDRITFRADITFIGQDGRSLTAKAAISDNALDGFGAGHRIQVRYLADRPDVIRIVGDEDEGSSWLLVIVGCAALVYGSHGILRALQRRK